MAERMGAVGESQSSLARAIGMRQQGIQAIVSGHVDRPRKLRELAQALKTTQEYLLGETDDPRREDVETFEVPIVGFVGAGARAHLFAEGQGPFGMVEAPEGATSKTVAVQVQGTSLGELFDGWLVFYDDVKHRVTADQVGNLCVVGLLDGRILVKKLQRGKREGAYDLLSNTEDPIREAEVAWAAKVRSMAPRLR